MIFGSRSLNARNLPTGRAVASGIFEYRYQRQALPVVVAECALIAIGVGLATHRIGWGIFTFVALMMAFGVPVLRQLLALALSGAYVAIALAFAREIASGSHHPLTVFDEAGIGLLVFLIAYRLHADFVSWVRDSA